MRVWFMVGAMVLGIMGVWGEQGRGTRGQRPYESGSEGTVRTMDGGSPVPPPGR